MDSPATDNLYSQALRSDSMSDRRAALEQLDGDKLTSDSASWIQSTLRDTDALVRRRGAALLHVLLYSPSVGDMLRRAARDPSWVVRESAIESIAKHLSAERMDLMEVLVDRSLHDRNRLIRDLALKHVLVHLDAIEDIDGVLDTYLAAAKEQRFALRCRAVGGLAALHARQETASKVIEQLVKSAEDSHQKVRAAVLKSLPRLGDQSYELIPVLTKRLFDPAIAHRDLVTAHLIRLTRSLDDLTAHSVSLVIGGRDPADRLRALLENPGIETQLGDELRDLCRRRLEWARATGGDVIRSDSAASNSLVPSVDDVIQAVTSLSRDESESRRRQQQLWFIRQIFELLIGRSRQANPPA